MRAHSLASLGPARQSSNVLHIHAVDLDNLSTRRRTGDDAHGVTRDAERVGKQLDERDIGGAIDRRCGVIEIEFRGGVSATAFRAVRCARG